MVRDRAREIDYRLRDLAANENGRVAPHSTNVRYRVSTEREGNAKAIMDQKAAMNVKTVVASHTYGDIAEGNVGEFLKYPPGVALDYVETDTRAARMGGMEARYGSVTLDGNSMANAGSNWRQLED